MRTTTDDWIDNDSIMPSQSIGGNGTGAIPPATEINDLCVLAGKSPSNAVSTASPSKAEADAEEYDPPPIPSPPSRPSSVTPTETAVSSTETAAAAATTTTATTRPTTTTPLWRQFQDRDHSLVVYASDVAACAGFHEFKSCPELMMGHCYQGPGGRALLRHDAHLLGLTLVSEDEQLQEIAQKAGPQTVRAVQEVLRVQRGEQTLATIESADRVRREVVQAATASQRLSRQQLDVLTERTRQSVDTGCGRSWEGESLDRYERQCGWEVRERNAECRVWHFQAVGGNGTGDDDDTAIPGETVPTIRAVGPAYAQADETRNVGRGTKREIAEPEASKSGRADSGPDANGTGLVDLTGDDDAHGDGETTTDIPEADDGSASNELASATGDHLPPFLTIRGMVDGVRDELAPGQFNDDESWVFSRVIVECKHRMRAMLPYPRLYECIQAVVYCLMYEAEGADIIQVLRTTKSTNRKQFGRHKENRDRQQPLPQQPRGGSQSSSLPKQMTTKGSHEAKKWGSLINYLEPPAPSAQKNVAVKDGIASDVPSDVQGCAGQEDASVGGAGVAATCDNGEEKDAETDGAVAGCTTTTSSNSSAATAAASTMEIAVNRVSLKDEYDHLSNWDAVILPNLRRWADAVYRIRRSDEKRYRLLSAMATAQSVDDPTTQSEQLKIAWQTVLDECPFLQDGYSGEVYRRETQSLSAS